MTRIAQCSLRSLRSLLAGALGALALSTLAAGQDVPFAPPLPRLDPEARLSDQEDRYLQGVHERLGSQARPGVSRPVSVELRYDASAERPDGRLQARGIRYDTPDAEVHRLRFRSAAEAERYAQHVDLPEAPHLLEVRGRQLLIARGPAIADPERAGELRAAAWKGLPHAAGPPSFAGVFLDRGETFFVESRGRPDRPASQRIQRAFEAAKGAQERGDPRADVDGREAWYRRPDLAVHVGTSALRPWDTFLRSTRFPEKARALRRYAEAFQLASEELGEIRGAPAADASAGQASAGPSQDEPGLADRGLHQDGRLERRAPAVGEREEPRQRSAGGSGILRGITDQLKSR